VEEDQEQAYKVNLFIYRLPVWVTYNSSIVGGIATLSTRQIGVEHCAVKLAQHGRCVYPMLGLGCPVCGQNEERSITSSVAIRVGNSAGLV
jgi:hypothetical protein